ncbi:MAG: hypothetical protein MRY64_13355 [Hyphomonadaceae bacterium]|nr:hypothetical protein [Hyphomonadaceae bacterium]
MLQDAEVVRNPDNPEEWIVEAQTEDGGVRRAIFIDADAELRARDYAEIIRSQHQLRQRRFEAVNAEGQYASPHR